MFNKKFDYVKCNFKEFLAFFMIGNFLSVERKFN